MNRTRCFAGRRAVCRVLPLGVALLMACAAAPAPTSAADAPSPGSALSGRHALLLFVAYRGNLPVPIHPTHLRETASRHIADTFAEAGGTFVTYPDVEPVMRKWRVRSEQDLGLPFLGELASAFHVDHVTVLKVVTYDDRILLLGRSLSPRTGLLEWADVAEVVQGNDLWSSEAGATAHLDEMVRSGTRVLLAGAAPARTGASPLLTLPLLPVGLDRGETDLAWQCLLGSLLRAERWVVPDPSLVVNEMQRGGFDPHFLDPRARKHLVDVFSARGLLVPRMTAFPRQGEVFAPAAFVDDEGSRSAQLDRRVPVLFTLSLVDGASGAVIAGGARYLTPEQPSGLFGRVTHRQMIRRYRESADKLVRTLLSQEGTS